MLVTPTFEGLLEPSIRLENQLGRKLPLVGPHFSGAVIREMSDHNSVVVMLLLLITAAGRGSAQARPEMRSQLFTGL